MIFKCKICGGSLDVKQGEKITVCEYCGVKQTIPTFIEPKIKEIYNRANNYLMHNEFDKAENLFNQILLDDNSNADAYWNIAMCRYGVSYVKDPATGKYIPTCNRTLYSSIYSDENYKNAIKYADIDQRNLFSTNAKIIDDIQRGILAVSKNEKPFDIFISYKEADARGMRTKDSVVAQGLYEKLTAEGYKVFFSRITLEDKVGTEYEPYIYAALASSKVMITVSSSKENIEAVWVKNEWSRFLSFATKDSSKTLIPLYYDMDKTDLPDAFAHISAYDMKVNGFEQELIRGIKKLIPLPIMLLERRKKRNKILKRAGIAVAACAVIGLICAIPWFAKLPEYNAAMQLYYDKNYPEATWAFNELGSYRDSEEMKEKCELSWRKSLARINATTLGNGSSAYYVTANGTADSFDYAPGTLNQNIDINEHGKITSIEMLADLAALYEDGYLKAYYDYSDREKFIELTDVIKASSSGANDEFVALKNDGTIFVKSDEENSWCTPASEWTSIAEIDCHRESHGAGGLVHEAVIAGITTDGDLKIAFYNFMNFDAPGTYDTSIHDRFKNISKVDTQIDEDLNIVALTRDGKLLTEIEGVFNSFDVPNAIDVELLECYDSRTSRTYYEVYLLYADGKVYKHGSNNYLMPDVVYMDNGLLVTRSGSIYRITQDGIEPTEGKTIVHNEWLERMN